MSLSRVGLPLVMLVFVSALHALSATCSCSADKLDSAVEAAFRLTPGVVRQMSAAIARRTSTGGSRSTDETRSTAGMWGTLQSLGSLTHRTRKTMGSNISGRLTQRQGDVASELPDDGERDSTVPSQSTRRAFTPACFPIDPTQIPFGSHSVPALAPGFRPSPGDRLELIESIVIQIQMTSSWRICVELILAIGSGIDGSDSRRFSYIGAALAGILFTAEVRPWRRFHPTQPHPTPLNPTETPSYSILPHLIPHPTPPHPIYIPSQIFLVSKYAYQALRLRDYLRGRAARAGGAPSPSFISSCIASLYGSRLSQCSLKHRLHFITERFASHAPYWQFVIWARQLALTAITLTPELFGEIDRFDDDRCGRRSLRLRRLRMPLLSLFHTPTRTVATAGVL